MMMEIKLKHRRVLAKKHLLAITFQMPKVKKYQTLMVPARLAGKPSSIMTCWTCCEVLCMRAKTLKILSRSSASQAVP
jgi:hypothetical protein